MRTTLRTPIKIILELDPDEAAALARLCDKFNWSHADRYLYGHVSKEVRSEQAYQMVHALAAVEKALLEAGVGGWPWLETGSADA